jgi:protein-disulfide isomerase
MVVHPQQVMQAHLTGCAAAKQGKFADFYNAWWDRAYKEYQDKRDPSFLGEENLNKIIADVGLDAGRVKSDQQGCEQVLQSDEEELRKFKVNGTPAFFINGEFVGGGIPKEAFKQIIDKKLQVAQASGVPGASYYEQEIRGKGEKAVVRKPRQQQ